jgi:hypothetical protein
VRRFLQLFFAKGFRASARRFCRTLASVNSGDRMGLPALKPPQESPPCRDSLASSPRYYGSLPSMRRSMVRNPAARRTRTSVYSKSLDTQRVIGKKISKISYPCLASMQGRKGDRGWGVGNYPGYQRFLFDYVRFEQGAAK